MKLIYASALTSPNFLYRIEETKAGKDPTPLNPYEYATRLSYFLWSSMPDAAPTAAAKDGKLKEPADIAAQVKRMLADPKASIFSSQLMGQWLGTDNLLAGLGADLKLIPGYDESLRAASLKRKVGINDQRKLDEYLTSVSDVEKQIESEIKELAKERRFDPEAARTIGQLGGVLVAFDGKDHTQRLRIMLDIMTLAFWTDSTRVGTFMFGHERNDLNYSFIPGVHSAHHDSSHHGGGEDTLDHYRKINVWHAEQVAYIVDRIKAIKEPNGLTLLDSSMFFWFADS